MRARKASDSSSSDAGDAGQREAELARRSGAARAASLLTAIEMNTRLSMPSTISSVAA